MKFYVENEEAFDLQSWQESVMKNDLSSATFMEEMKSRVRYIIEHKFEKCYERFEKEWMKKLRDDPSVTSIPTNKQAFVNMVISRSDYKNRDAREAQQ